MHNMCYRAVEIADSENSAYSPKSRNRQITLRDLLTFTIGTGIVVAEPGAVPIADALKAVQIDEPEQLPDE